MMTMSPGLSVDISTSSTYEGAPGALRRICARRVSRTQRPCVRVILVFAQASSMRQTGRVNLTLLTLPLSAAASHVGPILFAGAQTFLNANARDVRSGALLTRSSTQLRSPVSA